MRKRTVSLWLLSAALISFESSGVVLAQTEGNRKVLASGAVDAVNSTFRLIGTIGQPVIGQGATLQQAVWQGFWYPQQTLTATTSSPIPGDPLALLDCSPNPVAGSAMIHMTIPETGHITLALHDLLGRKVRTLVDNLQETGTLSIELNTAGMAEGRYTLQYTNAHNEMSLPILIVR